jgi:hypothetical protein
LIAVVAEKIRVEKQMHILTLAGNTLGIDAAKAIGKIFPLLSGLLICTNIPRYR